MDVTTYHVDSGRSGLNGDFSFDAAGTWRQYVTLTTQAPVRAAPLFLANWMFTSGPYADQTHDVVIVADSANNVIAFAEDQLLHGATAHLWATLLGTASPRTGSNIPPPIGVCSTPVIDRLNARIFVMALLHHSSGDVFTIFSLDLNTGAILDQKALNDAGAPSRPTFNSSAQDQRGALNLVGGFIFATFADFLGNDLGIYHGWIVACSANNLAQQLFLPTTTNNAVGGGVWGPGGVAAASDGTLYVSTGNALAPDNPGTGSAKDLPVSYWTGLPAGKHPGDVGDYFEGVIRVQLSSGPTLKVLDWYQPQWAKALNDEDLDFGGSTPTVLSSIRGRQLVVTTAKDGNVYLLDGTLGGWGSELWSSVRDTTKPSNGAFFAGESKCSPAYFHDSATGSDYVYVVGSGVPGLGAFQIDTSGAQPRLVPTWNADTSFSDGPGSPFIIVDPMTGKALVWVVDGMANKPAVLWAFDALTGQVIYTSDDSPSGALGVCPNFAPIACVGRSVFVGTDFGVVGHINVASDPRIFYLSSPDGQNWNQQIQVGGGTSTGPALAAFTTRLYLAWKGVGTDPRMFYCSTADGQTWTGQVQVGGGTSNGPALAAFNGRLYLAWKGEGTDPRMFYCSTADGQTWIGQIQVGGGTSHRPATAASNNRLYLACKGVVA